MALAGPLHSLPFVIGAHKVFLQFDCQADGYVAFEQLVPTNDDTLGGNGALQGPEV